MVRLGVAQRERLASAVRGRHPPVVVFEFAPAVVVDARRGGEYYRIRCVRRRGGGESGCVGGVGWLWLWFWLWLCV
jgi:hypothetical protein